MMVNVGDVIENPVTGERITFVRTSEQTGGALAELDLELSPTAFLAAEHIHRSQEEKFQVLEGRILLRCRGEESMCGPGETVVVPAGNPHAWAPHGGAAARVRITFTPGAGIEQFFDEFFRLAREGRVNSKGMPSLPVTARLVSLTTCTWRGRPCPCNVLPSGCWPRPTDCSTALVPEAVSRRRDAPEHNCVAKASTIATATPPTVSRASIAA